MVPGQDLPELLEEDADPLDGLPLGRVGQYPAAAAAALPSAAASGRDSGQVLQHWLHREHELQALQLGAPGGRHPAPSSPPDRGTLSSEQTIMEMF